MAISAKIMKYRKTQFCCPTGASDSAVPPPICPEKLPSHLGIDRPQIPVWGTFEPYDWSRAVRASQDTIPKFKTRFIRSIAPSLPRSAQALAVSINHLTDSASLLLTALANRPRLPESVQPICASKSRSCYLMLF